MMPKLMQGRNVNDIFPAAMCELLHWGEKEASRNGPVTVFPCPFYTVYERPCERVLFHRARRANPFFHLFEAFWMLAGRNDAKFLDRYVSNFGSRYAEENGTLHGAYGNRWRDWFAYGGVARGSDFFDQIEWVVSHLLHQPESRRAVIQMYDPALDSIVQGVQSPKDIPCNTTIYLRQRKPYFPHEMTEDTVLDLTVCCRSNDAIWGAYGANAVHFSILLEYLAFRLDCGVGHMYQFSNNLHVYEDTQHLFDPDEKLEDPYKSGLVAHSSLFSGAEPGPFAEELCTWFDDPSNARRVKYHSPVFTELLIPMSIAHDLIRDKQWETAASFLNNVRHVDWRSAGHQWIETRKK